MLSDAGRDSKKLPITKKPSLPRQKYTLSTYINLGIPHHVAKTASLYLLWKPRYAYPEDFSICRIYALLYTKMVNISKTVSPRAKVYIVDVYKVGYSASFGENPMHLSGHRDEIQNCFAKIHRFLKKNRNLDPQNLF